MSIQPTGSVLARSVATGQTAVLLSAIVDYFAAEVLAGLAPEVRSFLLRTSVLNRLCGPLCDAVAGSAGPTGSQELLEELERAQLFLVPMDTRRQWYRYHTLFAEWLRHELDRSEPGLAAQLHRRASAWHREHGSVTEAVDHAIRGGDPADARELIAAHRQRPLNDGQPETADSWLDRPGLARPPGRPALVEPLTSREREVLDLLAEGKRNRGIADELVVTLDTVKRHVTHILAKLGAANRTEAVARARERNLIP